MAVGLLSLLTGTGALELEGAELSRAVRSVCSRPGGRLVDVIDELEGRGASDTAAETVGRKLRALSAEGLAQLVFGDAEPLRLDAADFVVFHTPELSLPDRDNLIQEHLARRLLPEQVLSQALLYLIAACARKVAFTDTSRFSAVLVDEAWALTRSIEGAQLVFETVKDGRKHNAAMWLVSQHPDDLGEERIRDLLRNRLVFRQARASARRSLEYLGVDETEGAVALIEGLQTGECLLRDVRGRTGLVQILDAPTAELAEAFNTTPGRGQAA
ncbi:MAG: ATP-binding protein [Acidimicrobiia bacterium]